MNLPNLRLISSRVMPNEVREALNSLARFFGQAARQGGLPTGEEVQAAIGDTPTAHGIPSAPTGFVVTGAFASILLEWDKATLTEIWRAAVDDLGQAAMIGTTNSFVYTDTPPASSLSETYYYWIRHVNAAGVPGPYNQVAGTPGSTSSDPEYVRGLLLAQLGYENGVFPVRTVGTLPTLPDTDYPEECAVFLLPDGPLYWNVNNAWTAKIPAVTITGQLTNAQLESIAAAKVAGQLTNAQLESIAAAKVAGQLTNVQISDNAITAAKISAGAVETAKLAAGSVVADKIATNAITAAKISAGAVETAKLAAGAITAEKLAANSIVAGKIAAGAIVAGDGVIANAAIATAHLQDAIISTAKIGLAAVDSAKIANAAVTNAKIGDLQVTNAKIGDAAITNAKISNLAVNAAKIANGTITSAKIGDAQITNAKIGTAAVDTLKIAGAAVTVPEFSGSGLVSVPRRSTLEDIVPINGAPDIAKFTKIHESGNLWVPAYAGSNLRLVALASVGASNDLNTYILSSDGIKYRMNQICASAYGGDLVWDGVSNVWVQDVNKPNVADAPARFYVLLRFKRNGAYLAPDNFWQLFWGYAASDIFSTHGVYAYNTGGLAVNYQVEVWVAHTAIGRDGGGPNKVRVLLSLSLQKR